MDYRNNYVLRKKPWAELSHSLRMYGENEPPEMQIENMWEVIDLKTGEKLNKPIRDFSKFERGDILYPTMRKYEIQTEWEHNDREWKEETEKYEKIKRVAHTRFIIENQNLDLAQDLAKTEYGKAILAENADLVVLKDHRKSSAKASRTVEWENVPAQNIPNMVLLGSDDVDNLEDADYYWTMHPKSGACD